MWMTFFRMNKSTESGETSAHLPNSNDVSLLSMCFDSNVLVCLLYSILCLCGKRFQVEFIRRKGGKIVDWHEYRTMCQAIYLWFEWVETYERPILFSFYTIFNIKRHSSPISTCRMWRLTHSDIRTFIENQNTLARPSPPIAYIQVSGSFRSAILPNGKSSCFGWICSGFHFQRRNVNVVVLCPPTNVNIDDKHWWKWFLCRVHIHDLLAVHFGRMCLLYLHNNPYTIYYASMYTHYTYAAWHYITAQSTL